MAMAKPHIVYTHSHIVYALHMLPHRDVCRATAHVCVLCHVPLCSLACTNNTAIRTWAISI